MSSFDVESSGPDRGGDAATWLAAIEAAARGAAAWHKRCDKIRKRYRADGARTTRASQYQMLWANIETLKPAVFARLPQAVCSRRYRDADPTGRVAGELLERAVNFTFETGDYESRFKQVAADLVMYARGTARLRYEPVTVLVDAGDSLDVAAMRGPAAAFADAVAEAGDPIEVLDFEHVRLDFVAREDFIHPPARTWDEVPWIAFRVFLTRDELVRRFGRDIGGAVPLDASPELAEADRGGAAQAGGIEEKATLYEVWDKTERRVLWIAEGAAGILDEADPYLKLDGFFPCPRPAFGTMTTDSLDPVPDYVYYQDQAEEINKLTARIDALADSLKLVGFYPGGPQGEGAPEIERAVRPGFENRLIAVKSWAAFTESGHGGAPIVWLPIEMVADIIEKCIALRKELISDVWELTGVSDIMRGQGESDETATGVNAKSSFGMSRLSMKQAEMARFARDVARLVAEIVCDQFQPRTLMTMSNIALPSAMDVLAARLAARQGTGQPGAPPGAPMSGPSVEDVFALLQDGVMRRFRIDIETDSTIASDESRDRSDRTAFIGAVTQFVEGWAPLLMKAPQLAPLAGALLTFGARGFRIGRDLEDRIEEASDRLVEIANAPKPPPPSPEPADQIKLQVAQLKGQAELQKSQMDLQAATQQQQSQIETHQLAMDRAVLDHQQAIERHQMAMAQAAAALPVAPPGPVPGPPQAVPFGPPAAVPQEPGAEMAGPAGPADSADGPLVPGAQQAPDGHWYLPDPWRPAKHLKIRPGR